MLFTEETRIKDERYVDKVVIWKEAKIRMPVRSRVVPQRTAPCSQQQQVSSCSVFRHLGSSGFIAPGLPPASGVPNSPWCTSILKAPHRTDPSSG
jgi:hypothetical protein